MLEYLRGLLWDGLKRLAGWLLDLFIWFFQSCYEFVNDFLQWIFDFFGEMVVVAIRAIGPLLPEGLIDAIVAMYEWLEFINEWVPVKYGIGLLIAYFAIEVVFVTIRWILRLVPGLGG